MTHAVTPWAELRRSRAYRRFPELLSSHPDAAENAFQLLTLSEIALRDLDEWGEHHLSLASTDGNGGMFGAIRGQGGICRLAEIDGSAVAIVEASNDSSGTTFCGTTYYCTVLRTIQCKCDSFFAHCNRVHTERTGPTASGSCIAVDTGTNGDCPSRTSRSE